MTTWRLGRRPALDGLRGVAILLVVVSHTLIGTGVFQLGGAVGVDLFFALSGYLITGLLIPGVAVGLFDVRGFYVRRARRLLPAAYACILGIAVLLWAARDSWLKDYPHEALTAVLYGRNLVVFNRGGFDGVLGHMWSLSVEEQFYFLWPMILLGLYALARWLRVSPLVPVAGIAGTALAWRLWVTLTSSDPSVDHHLSVTAVALLGGAVVAVAESQGHTLVGKPVAVVAVVAVIVAGALPLQATIHPVMWVGLVVAFVAPLALTRGADLIGLLSHAVPRWFGRISYGWYLWHVPLMSIWINGHEPGMAQRVSGAALGLGLAVLSWRFVEEPILRRGRSVLEVDRLNVELRVGSGEGHRATREAAEAERHVPAGDIS